MQQARNGRSLQTAPTPNAPVGQPYQPPPALQAQILRLRKWCLLLGLGVVLLLVASVTAVVYFRQAPASAARDVAGAEHDDKPSKPLKKLAGLKSLPDIRESPPPRKLAATPAPGPAREPYLETIGGLSAVHLYQSYLNIGLLADAVENETYTRSEAISIMLTVSELVNLVEKQLQKLPKGDISTEDEAALEAVRILIGLLRTQSNALMGYWGSGEDAHADRYQTAREQCWLALREVLGLED